ncbi:protein SFI1 homolog [Xiphias gladius]|uniref:protein SFI1 homolog n=1 Tax=Xiphias gladius TaxID=8245 RepID=UPI001A99DBFB|nr:protein SFI1 homolog [Xiphias gladius]
MPVTRFNIMQDNTRKPDVGRPRPGSVRSRAETKHVRKVHTRKVPYRVGYSWNKGGRLKELRIRHLARKFLKIWMWKTFGRVLPHKAKSHYDSVVLRRAFEGWREEWWTSGKEWSLTMRAECHYRYYLYNLAFHSWRMFMSLQREKKSKVQNAQSYADRQRSRLVWDRWEIFTEMRRMKKRMLKSALEQNRLATLHSVWSLWQTRLQQHQDFYTLEDQALKQRALTLQRRAWLQWKEMHTASCCQKEKESKASLHFILRLKRKTFYQWMGYVSCCQTKRKSQGAAQNASYLRLVRMCWSNWSNALHRRWSEEDRLQAAGKLGRQSTQRRALERWRAYVTLCRDEAEINQMASQHYQHHLLSAGLQGLSLNVIWNKNHRLNNTMAIQHYYQTMMRKFWKFWQDRLEEAEDKSFQSLTEMAQTNYSKSVLSSCFHHWREKLAEQKHMQELEHRADVWFAERMLPRRFNSWVEFTLRRRLHKQRRHKAEVYNQQHQCAWVFYTWWERSEKHKEQMLSERMAILHEERCHVQRAWARWRQRTEQQINEEEKQKASDRLYLHRLLHNTMTQWKDNSAEIRDRRNREQQACHQGDLRCMKWALDKWKKFVQSQRLKKSKVEEMQFYHEAKLLEHTFVAWKTHHLQITHIYGHAEELYQQQTQRFLRQVLSVWRENAVLQAEGRLMEQRAQSHFQHFLQLKVFLAWREAITRAVSKRHQQGEAVSRAQRSINQVCLLQSLRQWRKQTREAWRERMCMEKARQHHNSKLLSKVLKAWNKHHYQYRKYKVMKRQGILLLRLKMYQTYFEQWKIKLQHRRREVKQTERALWHWSLTLQAKVLYGWRLWVTEQQRKQVQAARAAQVYRDQLLRQGVTCILTYAAHMNDLTTNLTQHSQEQRSRHLQRVVKRCALRWRQRALCKPRREQAVKGQPPKKSVTFCLTTLGLKSDSSSDSVEQEAEDGTLSKLLPTRKPRRQPRRCEELFESPLTVLPHTGTQNQSGITAKPSEFSSPSQKNHPAVLSCILPAEILVSSTRQSTTTSTVPPSERHASIVDSSQGTQNQDLLLPPSAFMTTGPQNMLGKTSSPGSGHAPLPPSHQCVDPFNHNSRYPEINLRASSEETEGHHAEDVVTDPASVLTRELLSIQLDMKNFQQDRKQLRAWQKLKEVLQSWLETTGEDEQMVKNSVCQELKELEERIDGLSAELAKRKPTMLLHAERIQHLQTVLHTSGVSSLCRKTKEMETDRSVFTRCQETVLVVTHSQSDCDG